MKPADLAHNAFRVKYAMCLCAHKWGLLLADQAQANRVLVDTPRNPTLYAPRDLTTHALFTPLTIMPAEVMIAKMYRVSFSCYRHSMGWS